MRNIKRILAVLFSVLLVLLSGCGFMKNSEDDELTSIVDEYTSYGAAVASNFNAFILGDGMPNGTAKEMGETVLECFDTKDKETLKSLFSENMITRYSDDLDNEIDIAFDSFDGEVVSYSSISSGATSRTVENMTYEANVYEIITDKGTEYYLTLGGYYRHDDDPADVGLYVVVLYNNTLKKEVATTDSEYYKSSYLYSYRIGIANPDWF